jgi:cellulose synthase/poly-beta-1,6-N-acetylglucosamine synthase-like glycosyltransferase
MDLTWLGRVTLTAYMVVLAILCIYGVHRYFLVATYYRVRNAISARLTPFAHLPRVTVQLPMYNERFVAERIIRAAGAMDYPADRLQIQVLDDSTDETREIAQRTVKELQARGLTVEYVHREVRTGYKAGALAEGTRTATGEFIAIFDADFLPPPNILLDTIQNFSDPQVGMVQCRWDHLNRDDSLLTQAQAVLLDGHFVIEHTARNRTGRFMSFNGTAGVWRRSAIDDAGGWQHDTLTEDLDLSYRAQLKGWRFVFLPTLTSPAELPPEMNAFKAQQHRWTKGGAQTCVKLLPAVLASSSGWRVKLEAFFHLTSCLVYILMVLLSILVGPAMLARIAEDGPSSTWRLALDGVLFFVGTGSALAFYIVSQRELQRGWGEIARAMPALMALGIGIAFNNAVAAIEGFFGKAGEFVRTPKFGDSARSGGSWKGRLAGFRMRGAWKAWAELALALYMTGCLCMCFFFENWVERVLLALPFLGLFIFGYFYVAVQTLYGQWLVARR